MDIPFYDNLENCQRYYQKSNQYSAVAGTAGWANQYLTEWGNGTHHSFPAFPKVMAGGTVTVNTWSNNGTGGAVETSQPGQWAVSSYSGATTGFILILTSTPPAAIHCNCSWHAYTAF
jgi:hypothetical protein